MKLESLLKPIKYLDEQVILRQYTKLGQKINIDKGKRKYVIGAVLWQAYCFSGSSNRVLFGSTFDWSSYFALGLNDGLYNLKGLFGNFKKEDNSEERVIDPEKEFHSRYNSYTRLPTFLFGAGLVGKFGIDLVNSIKNKTPMNPLSYHALIDGIRYLSLASSMYLKETNPKLLDRVPLWKRALESLKEKIGSLAPSPIPEPTFGFVENR